METAQLRYRTFWLITGYVLVALVFYLSLTPEPPRIETSITFFDKIGHFTAYFVLMGWFAQIYFTASSRRTCVVLFVLMGVLIEILQSFEVSRTFEWYDMLANTLGVILAWMVTLGKARFVLAYLSGKGSK